MKRRLALALTAALLALAGNRLHATADDDNADIGVHQSGRFLVFPSRLQMEGVVAGKVQVVLSVDAEGKLTDCLVVGYSNRGFADEVTAVLPTWTFDPARIHGQPQASRVDLEINFSTEVNVSVVNLGWHYWEHVTGDWSRLTYHAYRLGDLDRTPTPVEIVRPSFSEAQAPSSDREVTVEFFIDETGRVRIPTCDREHAHDAFAAAAIAAVEKWRFEPPVRHGQPVLVLARQDFRFRAKH